jgi:hypothetical protein
MRARPQAGFTLLELVISTTVLMVVMLFALQMLGEAGKLYSNAQVEFAEPSLDLTTRWLRRDSQGASELALVPHEATPDPLELWGNVEGLIRYEKVGDSLERVILGMEGEEIGRRTMLRGVVRWQWRAVAAGLVEIELIYQHRVAPPTTRHGGPPVELALVSEKRRFALRGLPRSSW